MTDKQLKDWMERFFDAELTVDEERELYRYLCANEVSAELRKDREVILALYSIAEEDIELPEGAAERLEAMLDGLEEMKTHLNLFEPPSCRALHSPHFGTNQHSVDSLSPHSPCEGGLKKVRPRYTLPHREGWGGSFLLRAACAAAVVAVLFLVIPYGSNKYADEKAMLAMVDDVDKDTFDTPEEAMECLMAAYEDIMFAMNTARDNTREVHQALTQSVMTNLNLLKLEPTKNREL